VEKIVPYARNPRKNDEAVDAVAASIKEFGFRQPIVIDGEGVIVVGETRYKAARRLGLKRVPVHVATELTEAQVKAYRIADNRLNEIATWDPELLPLELTDLQGTEIDLSLLGFTEDELNDLLGAELPEGMTEADFVPEPPDEAVTQAGDLWILGEHRLLCGDAGSAEDVDQLLEGQRIHLVNTDPPYNVNVEPRSNNAIVVGRKGRARRNQQLTETLDAERARNRARMHHQAFGEARQGKKHATTKKLRPKDRPLEGDFVTDEEFAALLRAWFGEMARVLEPGRGFYIWGGYANCANYPAALAESKLYFSQAIIWVKEHPVLTRKDFMGNHEWCFYGWKEGAGHQFFGPNNATDVWSLKKVPPQNMVHLTEKPVELATRAMGYSSRRGENVLDLFGGSGSTLIGAEQTGRRAFLMEIDPLYCDVIVTRWERFTGKKAKRQELKGGKRRRTGTRARRRPG